MIGLIASTLDEPVALHQTVQISVGPLTGLRGTLVQLSEDGRATIKPVEQPGVWLVVPAKNISPNLATH